MKYNTKKSKWIGQVTLLVVFIFGSYSYRAFQEEKFETYEQKLPGDEVSYKMVTIPGGEFLMGSPNNEEGHQKDEGPSHRVKVSPFWMGEHEVTHDEFNLFIRGKDEREAGVDGISRPTPQYIDLTWGMGKEGGYPANSMSQYAAMMYCKWLYEITGDFYRLPTEAEWEYASRAGAETTYYFGNDPEELSEYAWYAENSDGKYHKVMELKPNEWGLYDMLGNVAEWTLDQYDENYFEELGKNNEDPKIELTKTYPVTVRGGHFSAEADQLRSASRMASAKIWNVRDPQIPKSKWWLTDAEFVGFRIVRPLKQPSKEEIEKFYDTYLKN